MQLRAATKPTDTNFVRVIRKRFVNQGCHKRLYRHMFFWIIWSIYLFETSGTASCGTTGIFIYQIIFFDEIDTSTTLFSEGSNLVAFHHFSFLDICVRNVLKKRTKSEVENPFAKIFEPPGNIPLRKEGNFVMVGLRGSRKLIPKRTEQTQTQHLTLWLNCLPSPWKDQRSIYPTCLRV